MASINNNHNDCQLPRCGIVTVNEDSGVYFNLSTNSYQCVDRNNASQLEQRDRATVETNRTAASVNPTRVPYSPILIEIDSTSGLCLNLSTGEHLYLELPPLDQANYQDAPMVYRAFSPDQGSAVSPQQDSPRETRGEADRSALRRVVEGVWREPDEIDHNVDQVDDEAMDDIDTVASPLKLPSPMIDPISVRAPWHMDQDSKTFMFVESRQS